MSSTAFQTLSFKFLCFLKKAKTNVKAFSFAAINAFPQTIPKERKASRPEEPRLIRAASGARADRAGADLGPRTPSCPAVGQRNVPFHIGRSRGRAYPLLLSAPLKQDGGLVRAC